MFKTMLAEIRESFNADYARQMLIDNKHMPFRERMRLVRETQEYKLRTYLARTRATWITVVGLAPLAVLAIFKVSTHALDGDVPPWIAIPMGTIYVVAALTVGWRIGTVRASRTLAQQGAAHR